MDDTSIAADLSAAMSEASASSTGSETSAAHETSAQPGAATTVPAEGSVAATTTTEQVAGKQEQQGPIPFLAHKTALDNARTKAVEEWEQQYGWAKQVDRQAVAEAARLGTLYQQDRAAFVRELIGDAPDPQLVSEFARVLSSRRGQGAEAAIDLEPDVPLMDAAGNPTGMATYSAAKVKAVVAHEVQQAIALVMKEVAPLKESQKAAADERRDVQRQSFSASTTKALRDKPYFAEHEAAIKADFANAKLRDPDDFAEVEAALNQSYLRVLTTKVLPNLQANATKAVVQTQQQKAEANTVTPGSPGSGTPKDPSKQSWTELFTGEIAARR